MANFVPFFPPFHHSRVKKNFSWYNRIYYNRSHLTFRILFGNQSVSINHLNRFDLHEINTFGQNVLNWEIDDTIENVWHRLFIVQHSQKSKHAWKTHVIHLHFCWTQSVLCLVWTKINRIFKIYPFCNCNCWCYFVLNQ